MDHVKKHKVKQNIVRRFTVFDNLSRANSHDAKNATGRDREVEFGCARDLMSLMMIKEQFQDFYEISGRTCYINASFANGRVVGHICMAFNNRKMDFDFQPLNALRQKQILWLELKRLFLDYQRDENGKLGIVLDVIPEDEYLPKNDYNLLDTHSTYLGQIDGAP